MGLQNCYVGRDGCIWKESTLFKHAEDHAYNTYLDLTEDLMDTMLHWKTSNARDMANHIKRCQDCELDIPVTLSPEGKVLDGWHRIIKAWTYGMEQLPARKLTSMPKPDFDPNE